MNRTVILAAGNGTRMKSQTPKVLHKAAGRTLVEWVVSAAEEAFPGKPIVISVSYTHLYVYKRQSQ